MTHENVTKIFRALFRTLRIFQTEETTQHSTLSYKKTIGTFSNKIQRIRFALQNTTTRRKNLRGAGGSSLSTIIICLLKSSGAAAVGHLSANFSRVEVAAPRGVGR